MADTLDLPVIDLAPYLAGDEAGVAAQAAACADALHRYGILIVRDPRATEEENNQFLDMMEAYFGQPEDAKKPDIHPEVYYQVGATPSRVELPRDHCDRLKAWKETEKPLSLCPPEKDPKWRFFWRIGDRPAAGETKFEQLNAAAVVPAAFPQWSGVMDSWGGKLLGAATAVAELAAIGFGLPRDAISSRMVKAPHLLAPTGSDLGKFGAVGTVLAGFHYDLNAFTAHGASRFPGLYIWTREGVKKTVKIPKGCLLVQAGKQAEYLTGGHVLAGFHEVVVTDATAATIEAAKSAGKSLWRVSSTLFAHIASDVVLEPLGRFAEVEGAKAAYPPIYTGEQVAAELAAINLGEGSDGAAVTAQ